MKTIQRSKPSEELSRGFMCSKQHFHQDAINYLKQASIDCQNLYVFLLLAEMYERVDDFNNADQAYISALNLMKTMKDEPLLVEISLSRIKCYTSDTKAIDDLTALEKQLNVIDADTTWISLQAIVCDTLASYYAKIGKYSIAITYADTKSITLKMRSLSHYHLSLAKNYLFLAEMRVRRNHYRQALKRFKNALEIQYLNLASDDINIKLVYYRMGDTYCKMNQLDEALHKYEFADGNDATEDADEENPDAEYLDDRRRLLSRASMHRHLAELYANRLDFESAIEEQSLCTDIVKEIYPFDTPERQIDMPTLVIHLQQLAFCTTCLADATALENSDNPIDIYKKAMAVQRKLIRFKEVYLGELYRKMGHYYERQQNDKEMAISCYEDAIQESLEPGDTIDTYYALGKLTASWGEDEHAAVAFYKKAITLIPDEELELKMIVEAKCSMKQVQPYRVPNNEIVLEDVQQDNHNKENDDNESTENVPSSFQQPIGMLIDYVDSISFVLSRKIGLFSVQLTFIRAFNSSQNHFESVLLLFFVTR